MGRGTFTQHTYQRDQVAPLTSHTIEDGNPLHLGNTREVARPLIVSRSIKFVAEHLRVKLRATWPDSFQELSSKSLRGQESLSSEIYDELTGCGLPSPSI